MVTQRQTRIEKLEKIANPKRYACFSVIDDVASGSAWWSDLTWHNLNRREYEQLKKDLEAEGVQIIVIFDIEGVRK